MDDQRYRLLEDAMMALATGRPESAIAQCESILATGPVNAWFYKVYATALMLVGRLEEAAAAAEQLSQAAGDDPKFQFDSGIVMGEVALRRSRVDDRGRSDQLIAAESALNKAASLLDYAGKFGRCLVGALQVEVLLDLGRTEEAREAASKILESLKGTILEGGGLTEEGSRETTMLVNALRRAGLSPG